MESNLFTTKEKISCLEQLGYTIKKEKYEYYESSYHNKVEDCESECIFVYKENKLIEPIPSCHVFENYIVDIVFNKVYSEIVRNNFFKLFKEHLDSQYYRS